MGFEATFLNAHIHEQNAFCEIGNIALLPYRYLFGGRQIFIISDGEKKGVHHFASLHARGEKNICPTNPDLHSARKSMLRTAFAIVLLIPGLLIGLVFKGLGYLFSSQARDMHHKVMVEVLSSTLNQSMNNVIQKTGQALNQALNGQPVDASLNLLDDMIPQPSDFDALWKNRILNIQTIGSSSGPIKNEFELNSKLNQLTTKAVDVLIIQGDGKLQINGGCGIPALTPAKIILLGARLGQGIGGQKLGDENNSQPYKTLINTLKQSGNWEFQDSPSAKEALKADPVRNCLTRTRWQTVYTVKTLDQAKKVVAQALSKGKPGDPKPPGFGPKGNIYGLSDIRRNDVKKHL